MKASWTETQEIERYMGSQDPDEQEQLRVKMLCDADFSEKVLWQQTTYTYIRAYAQEALKREIAQAQKVVFERPVYEKFRNIIQHIFS